MFRNKIMVRATPPFSPSSSPFLVLQLRLDHPAPRSSPTSSDPDHLLDPSLSLKVEALSWELSRKWRVPCLCFPRSPDVFVVYQRVQSESVDRVVEELVRELPVANVGAEEEVTSSSLVVEAVECALRCEFLDSRWRCLGNNLFVSSDFSHDDEKSHLGALNVRIQLEMDDGLAFIVSPDVVRFSRYKIGDILSSKMYLNFRNGKEVNLEDHNTVKPCYVLPSLHEGYVIGLGKVLTSRENLEQFKKVWSIKHGLSLPDDYFIKIQLTSGGHPNKNWLPSAYVLQGSGLAPAPQTTRVMKAVYAMDSFVKIVEGWNFFGQGCLRVQVVSSLNIGSELSTWTKASNAINFCLSRDSSNPSRNENMDTKVSIPTDVLSPNDFRTPKPAGCVVGNKMLEHAAPEKISKIASKILRNKRIDKRCPLSGPLEKTTGAFPEESHAIAESHKNNICKDSGKNAEKVKNTLMSGNSQEEKSDVILGSNSVSRTEQDKLWEVSGKQIVNKREKPEKSKGNMKVTTKKRPKVQSDPSDITAKVINYHKRGQLESLTVVELKCFLASKKAKVGGRKEDLIQRVVSLFD